MSSLFDVPIHLVMILALAVGGGETSGPALEPHTAAREQAGGPYRLSEQIWLGALEAGVGGDILEDYRPSIFLTSSGRYYVPAEAHRTKILELRREPAIAALVTLGLARRNAALLAPRLGRTVTAGDLYVAHVLGADTAATLLSAAERTPALAASTVLPDLVSAGPGLGGKDGKPLSVSGLVKRLTRSFSKLPGVPSLPSAAGPGTGQSRVASSRESLSAEPAAAHAGGRAAPHLIWVTEVHAGP